MEMAIVATLSTGPAAVIPHRLPTEQAWEENNEIQCHSAATGHADNSHETYRVLWGGDSNIAVGAAHQQARRLNPPARDNRARPVI